jgi:hypothetical protein
LVRWSKTLLRILEELNYPPVFLVPKEQFEKLEGVGVGNDYGISSDICIFPVYALCNGMRGKVLANVIYHEIGHKLFPYRQHWWIECFAQKMARGGGAGYYSKKYGHTPEELPSREQLIRTSHRASERMKLEYVKKKPKTRKANSR